MHLNIDELNENYESVLESVSSFDSSLYPMLCILRSLMDTNDSLSDISDKFEDVLIRLNEIDQSISALHEEISLLTGREPKIRNIMDDDIVF